MKDLRIGAACMYESGIRNGGGRILLSTCSNTVRSIDFVTFQSHLNFGSDDSIIENQFANMSRILYLTSVRQHSYVY